MKQYLFLLATFFCGMGQTFCQQDTTQHIVDGRRNNAAAMKAPYVILISADGFRYDYADKYQAANLQQLGKQGVQAEAMIPSFPSLTFPNHYTIVTGLYPSHHGLVNNTFFDPAKQSLYSMGNKAKVRDSSWYGGTPLWVLAEQQHMISANMFWVGSEAAVQGVRSTYSYFYSEKISIDRRIAVIKEWLSLPPEARPHFITLYFADVDHAGHAHGPDAPETGQAVQTIDTAIAKLTAAVKETGLPVNFIFVSDHGMTAVDPDHALKKPAVIDTAKFMVAASGTMMVLHARNKADIPSLYDSLLQQQRHYKVYLKSNMPAYLHYSDKDDTFNRLGDIMLLPEWPYVFSERRPGAGHHGFDATQVKDMQATFIAWGPAFKTGMRIPAFENIHVYPMVAHILDLHITTPVDGRDAVLHPILK